MEQSVVPAQYLQIALNLAERIAKGELPEGRRMYGRSIIASEYGVSPETVRKAFHLLADMEVIEIKPQSGAVVRSAENARHYIQNFSGNADSASLKQRLKNLISEASAVNKQLLDTAAALLKSREAHFSPGQPFPNYTVPVPEDSPLIGKNIGELKFWQSTGATIVAIRREQTVILSPGPYAELHGGDIIILVGSPDAAEAAFRLVTAKE